MSDRPTRTLQGLLAIGKPLSGEPGPGVTIINGLEFDELLSDEECRILSRYFMTLYGVRGAVAIKKT